MFKLIDKKVITNLGLKNLHNWPYDHYCFDNWPFFNFQEKTPFGDFNLLNQYINSVFLL